MKSQTEVEKKMSPSHLFFKVCFVVNCFLFNLVYASNAALGEAA